MLVWKSRNLTIAETWFDEPLPAAGDADVVNYRQAPQPLDPDAEHCYTLVTNLSLCEETLFTRIQNRRTPATRSSAPRRATA